MSETPTYDDVLSYARQIRQKVFKAVAYDVVLSALKPLAPSVSGELFEAPTRLILDPGRSSPQSMPPYDFRIIDPSTLELYTDLGVRTFTPYEIPITAEDYARPYRRTKYATYRKAVESIVYLRYKGELYVLEPVGDLWRVTGGVNVPSSDVYLFTYPETNPPYLDENNNYHVFMGGICRHYEYVDEYSTKWFDASVCTLNVCAYKDTNGKWVSQSGYYVKLINYDDQNNMYVNIPSLVDEILEPTEMYTMWVTPVWKLITRGTLS